MYQYNSNGQKVPIGNASQEMPVQSKEDYTHVTSENNSKKTTWVWVGLVIALVVILVGLFMWLRGRSGSSTVSMGMNKGRMGAQRWGFRFY